MSELERSRARRRAFHESIAAQAAALKAAKLREAVEGPGLPVEAITPEAIAAAIAPWRDRVEELQRVLGVDRSLTSRLRDRFGLESATAPILGMLLNRNYITHDSLYTVLFAGRPECDWPKPKILDVQICKLRKKLKPYRVAIKTRWGEGWSMSHADKAKVRALLDPASVDVPVATADLGKRRQAFLEGV